jgi:hypothetical protein
LKSFSELFNLSYNWKKCEILSDLKNSFTIKELKQAGWVISRRVGRMYYNKTGGDNKKVEGKWEVKRKLLMNVFGQFMDENSQPTSLTGRRGFPSSLGY